MKLTDLFTTEENDMAGPNEILEAVARRVSKEDAIKILMRAGLVFVHHGNRVRYRDGHFVSENGKLSTPNLGSITNVGFEDSPPELIRGNPIEQASQRPVKAAPAPIPKVEEASGMTGSGNPPKPLWTPPGV